MANTTVLESKKDAFFFGAETSLVQFDGGKPFWIQTCYLESLHAMPEAVAVYSTALDADGGDDFDVRMQISNQPVQTISARHLPLLAALMEAGAPAAALTRSSLSNIGCLTINPAWHMDTQEDAATRWLCDFLGIGQSKRAGGKMLLHSDACGQEPRQLCYSPVVDVAHISLLVVSVLYWDVMPARLKESRFLLQELPAIMGVTSAADIERPHIRSTVMAELRAELGEGAFAPMDA